MKVLEACQIAENILFYDEALRWFTLKPKRFIHMFDTLAFNIIAIKIYTKSNKDALKIRIKVSSDLWLLFYTKYTKSTKRYRYLLNM